MANVFSGDSSCKAVWRFESGALTTDSQSTNTLTDNNTVGTDTTNYKEGGAAASFDSAATEYFSITDANLSATFPLKTGVTTKKISSCCWFRPDASASDYPIVYGRYTASNGYRSFGLNWYEANNTLYITLGYNSGNAAELSAYSAVLTNGRWYHVTVTWQDSDKAYKIRIWDDYNSTFLADITGNFTNAWDPGTSADFTIGARNLGSKPMKAVLDELVIFDRVLTESESDSIKNGTFGAAASNYFMPQFMNHKFIPSFTGGRQ